MTGGDFDLVSGATVSAVNCNVVKAHDLIPWHTGEGMGADVTVSITVERIDNPGTYMSHYILVVL